MGTSHPETKQWGVDKINGLGTVRVLDVGAGAGNWLDWLAKNNFKGSVDALEVWEPYIRKFKLQKRYDKVIQVDARDWDDWNYDVVILGDIVEHMTKGDAVALVEKIGEQARYVLIALPIIHYHQGALDGNPYEVHVKEDWSHEEMLETFPNITDSAAFSVTGAYWLCYNS